MKHFKINRKVFVLCRVAAVSAKIRQSEKNREAKDAKR
jgi:hypothetical protein